MKEAASGAGGWRHLAVCRLLLWLFAVCAIFEAPLGSRSFAGDNSFVVAFAEPAENKRVASASGKHTEDQSVGQGPLPGLDGQRSGDIGDEVVLAGSQRLVFAVPERVLAEAFPAVPVIRSETGAPGARAPPRRG